VKQIIPPVNKIRFYIFFVILLIFIAHTIISSPNSHAELEQHLLHGLFTFDYGKVDLSIICVFNVLGIVPLFLGTYLIPFRKQFNIDPLPFWIGSFFLGGYSLLPWLALVERVNNKEDDKPNNHKPIFLYILRFSLLASIVGLLIWSFISGNPKTYFHYFLNARLVNIMSIDLAILMLIVFPYLQLSEIRNAGKSL
jgi:hypothetical protein